jgi:hypothetical protein
MDIELLDSTEKAVVEEYLKSSGLQNASIHLGAFLENYWKFVALFFFLHSHL